jgi:thiamine pyrophosphate-dependent acetolactate synthase large subunit-like protein
MFDRIKILEKILALLSDEVVFASCGLVSRSIYFVRDRPLNFYVQSTMGSTLAIAMGFAMNSDRKVIAILGDGEALMELNSLVTFNKLKLPNLSLIILDNQSYESTGKQPTASDAIDFTKLCDCVVYHIKPTTQQLPRIPLSPKEIKERFVNAINSM